MLSNPARERASLRLRPGVAVTFGVVLAIVALKACAAASPAPSHPSSDGHWRIGSWVSWHTVSSEANPAVAGDRAGHWRLGYWVNPHAVAATEANPVVGGFRAGHWVTAYTVAARVRGGGYRAGHWVFSYKVAASVPVKTSGGYRAGDWVY